MAHRHIIGQSSTGKSSLLAELFLADQTATKLFFNTGTVSVPHTLYFSPATNRWNPLREKIGADIAPQFFARQVKDAYGYTDLTTPVMSMYLSFTAAALLESGRNITDAPALLTDPNFRSQLHLHHPLVKDFWTTFETYTTKDQRQETASTLNKFLTLLLDTRVERMLNCNHRCFSVQKFANNSCLIDLSADEYEPETIQFIGSLLLAYAVKLLPNASIYLDNAWYFAPGTVTQLLTAHNHSLTLAHQSSHDVSFFADLQANCAETYAFRVTHRDAALLEPNRTSGTPGKWLYDLPPFTYRRLPNDRSPDRITMPLEN